MVGKSYSKLNLIISLHLLSPWKQTAFAANRFCISAGIFSLQDPAPAETGEGYVLIFHTLPNTKVLSTLGKVSTTC